MRVAVFSPIAAGIVILAGSVAACTPSAGLLPGHHAADPRTSAPVNRAARPAPAASHAAWTTRPTGWGIQARWAVLENRRPGTGAWRIPQRAPRGISGFADHADATVGQQVRLFVSTSAPTFRVYAYRMGYYRGAGARLVWRSPGTTGVRQPACSRRAAINLVSCANWRRPLAVTLGPQFVQGDYLFKLVGSGDQQSYVPLTVWQPQSAATYLVKNDVLTWQAWNTYGGYDFYAGRGSCPPTVYPLCSRARVVSFDRPYAGRGAYDFLVHELPLVRFVEQHGLDVSYATDLTVIQHPDVLANHRALLSLGHDECWSLAERRAVRAAYHRGMNVAFLGASAMLRHVRLQNSPLGPDRQVVDYRDSSADPLDGHGPPLEVTGNTWSDPPASWSEVPFVGEAYTGFVEPDVSPRPLVVAQPHAWIFRGTGVGRGTRIPAMLASDVDGVEPLMHPADLQVFAHSPISLADGQSQLTWGGVFYSDMTYYTNPASGAGVFDSGTNHWITALRACSEPGACPSSFTARVTGNVLQAFGTGPAGRVHPSRSNLAGLTPY